MKGGKKYYIKNIKGGLPSLQPYKKKCDIDDIDIKEEDSFRILQTNLYNGIYKYHNYIEVFNNRKKCIYTIGIITDASKKILIPLSLIII